MFDALTHIMRDRVQVRPDDRDNLPPLIERLEGTPYQLPVKWLWLRSTRAGLDYWVARDAWRENRGSGRGK
jgi:hypothetical protein